MNTFIFDLDGTLLPMNQELFLQSYFKALGKKMVPLGYEEDKLIGAVWTGTKAMIMNDGANTNDKRFWDTFVGTLGEEARDLEAIFEGFYQNEFNEVKATTTNQPLASECIKLLKEKGYQVALATNPLFPKVAVHQRMKWAGLNPDDFIWITSYENSSYCKPNVEYYKFILKMIEKQPEECIMIGNDVEEDMCVDQLGMDTYLLKDCMINSSDIDITNMKSGNFEDLYEYIKILPNIQ